MGSVVSLSTSSSDGGTSTNTAGSEARWIALVLLLPVSVFIRRAGGFERSADAFSPLTCVPGVPWTAKLFSNGSAIGGCAGTGIFASTCSGAVSYCEVTRAAEYAPASVPFDSAGCGLCFLLRVEGSDDASNSWQLSGASKSSPCFTGTSSSTILVPRGMLTLNCGSGVNSKPNTN